MKEITKSSVLASTLGFLVPQYIEGGLLRPKAAKPPKEFTAFDQGRLDRAAAKREYRARVKMCLFADAEARKLNNIEYD